MSSLKIAVATHYAPNFLEVGKICDSNRIDYCKIHGYTYERKYGEIKKYCYDKYDFILELLEKGYDYVWWTDADGLITNFQLKIENYINNKKDFIISKDVNGFNDGSFIIRNTSKSMALIKHILEKKSYYEQFETQAQVFLEREFKNYLDTIQIVDQEDINAYLYFLYNFPTDQNGSWKYGSWFLHFPGTTTQKRIELMNMYIFNIKRNA